RLAQGRHATEDGRRTRAHAQRPRSLRDRLRALHVLRDLRRSVSIRCTVLEPALRVFDGRPFHPDARDGHAREVDGLRAAATCARGARACQESLGPEAQEGAVVSWPAVFVAIFGSVAALAAIAVVVSKNVVHAALYLVIVLGAAGSIFLMLGAEFVGWTQILIYVG